MDVQILNRDGVIVWARSPVGGFTSSAYRGCGTLDEIKRVLELALAQCKAELTISDNSD